MLVRMMMNKEAVLIYLNEFFVFIIINFYS